MKKLYTLTIVIFLAVQVLGAIGSLSNGLSAIELAQSKPKAT